MHKSVLLKEVIENLDLKENDICIDCTIGFSGHSKEILKRIKKGWLYGIDQDKEAIEYSNKELKKIGNNFTLTHTNFKNISKVITKVDKILFDLGVSSYQIDNLDRGFSYQNNCKLDMRMNKDDKKTAYTIVNTYSYEDLVKIFYEYGEEKFSKKIAKNIIKYREQNEIKTTFELVDIIKDSIPKKNQLEKHPAKRIFQAIRIEVNNELEVLKEALEMAIKILNKDGIICVISFHSLEDKIVKNIFKKYSSENKIYKTIPTTLDSKAIVYKKIKPSLEEINENSRSKSAILRTLKVIKEIA